MKQLVKAFILLFCCLVITAGCGGKPTAPTVTPKTEQVTVTPTEIPKPPVAVSPSVIPTPEKTTSTEEIFEAVKKGDVAKVKQLITADKKLLKAKDKDGNTPLHIAAKEGQVEVVKLLLSKGADKKAKNNNGQTPLFWANYKGHKEVEELLNPTEKPISVTPAPEKTEGLFEAYTAVKLGNTLTLKQLLESNPHLINASEKGYTLLHHAVRYDRKKIVELLLEKGADVSTRAEGRSTPLHWAVSYGQEEMKEIVELLLDAGADVNAKSKDGLTALHVAVFRDRKEIVELLLAKGADVNAKNKDDKTPLRIAVEKGYKEIAKLLRQYRAKE